MTIANQTSAERGEVHTAARTIGAEHTVPRILPGSSLADRGEPVRATASLIAMLEDGTWEVVAPDVPAEFAMLGRGGTCERAAPTLPGQQLRIEVERGRDPVNGRPIWTARHQRRHGRAGRGVAPGRGRRSRPLLPELGR